MKVFTKTVELTKAQVEGLFSGSPVPFDIVAAPKAGYALSLVGAKIWKTAGNAATVGTAEINVSYGASVTPIAEFTNVNAAAGALGNNAQDRIQYAIPIATNAVAAEASSLSISSSAAIAAATGTKVKVSIDFTIVKL
jgi:hypothetical protein